MQTLSPLIAGQARNGANLMKMARLSSLAILKKIPDERMLHRPVPGANHALWIMGHLAYVEDEILQTIAGRPSFLGVEWKERFATGSTVSPAAGDYPDPPETRRALSRMRKELSAWFESLSEAELLAELPGRYQGVGDLLAICPFVAWHENYHTGQLSVIRKSLDAM